MSKIAFIQHFKKWAYIIDVKTNIREHFLGYNVWLQFMKLVFKISMQMLNNFEKVVLSEIITPLGENRSIDTHASD